MGGLRRGEVSRGHGEGDGRHGAMWGMQRIGHGRSTKSRGSGLTTEEGSHGSLSTKLLALPARPFFLFIPACTPFSCFSCLPARPSFVRLPSRALPQDQRPPPGERRFNSTVIEAVIADVTSRMSDPVLAQIFGNAFPNTLGTAVCPAARPPPVALWEHVVLMLLRWTAPGTDTTVDIFGVDEDGYRDTFIITGDIEAMWFRDSTNQVRRHGGGVLAGRAATSRRASLLNHSVSVRVLIPSLFGPGPSGRTVLAVRERRPEAQGPDVRPGEPPNPQRPLGPVRERLQPQQRRSGATPMQSRWKALAPAFPPALAPAFPPALPPTLAPAFPPALPPAYPSALAPAFSPTRALALLPALDLIKAMNTPHAQAARGRATTAFQR